ncbi:hypothetical protein MKZ38_006766 [Zalerion maritima]|uniref:Subtilisin-like serine protease n=1 Tax=Zalerion maritima TaxID=339359 RepID=A0AAD5WNK4_9PEZI|nr:hypothetical protein MKZ38_006766 [Zalerion maritima]
MQAPFKIQVLEASRQDPKIESSSQDPKIESPVEIPKIEYSVEDCIRTCLPSSYRRNDNIELPHPRDLDFFRQELDPARITAVLDWLWVVGRPMPPRPLHHQLILGREIFITEMVDMHLVWTTGRIFLKPVPRYLLDRTFWESMIGCPPDCCCQKTTPLVRTLSTHDDSAGKSPSTSVTQQFQQGQQSATECESSSLRKHAFGFLFSYSSLIQYESDYDLAVEKKLLPSNVSWQGWRTLVSELLSVKLHSQPPSPSPPTSTDPSAIYSLMSDRYLYGELRLSRLNKLYRIILGQPLRGYMAGWTQYRNLFHENFEWLASATVYIAIVLGAMQVGLATDKLIDHTAFQAASYGFTVFSILGPLAAMALILVLFLVFFFANWMATRRYWMTRMRLVRPGLGHGVQ